MHMPENPVIVISYNDDARNILVSSLNGHDVATAACSTFIEAEKLVTSRNCRGLLIDLTSIIKAKGEEKIVACTLTNFFPTMRVRTVGSMLVPMTMPGEARQDSSITDFLKKSCTTFTPRKLRSFRRHSICLSTLLHHGETTVRGFSLNISWEGAFIIDNNPERMNKGEEVTVSFPEFQTDMAATVCHIQHWGGHRPPGIGVRFRVNEETPGNFPGCVLKHPRETDRDRISPG